MSHRVILVVVVAAAAALLVPTAAADPPTKEPLGSPDATGRFCPDFDVRLHVTDDKEVIHTFSSGVGLITGVFKVEVTNLTTNETIALNISGPGKFAADGSSLTGYGNWLLFGAAGDLGPDTGPSMTLVSGQLTIEFGPTGIAGIEMHGHIEDLCAALAAG